MNSNLSIIIPSKTDANLGACVRAIRERARARALDFLPLLTDLPSMPRRTRSLTAFVCEVGIGACDSDRFE